jgi:hypothetical protein
MADGAFKNIEAIRPGEMVQSITGPRAVITAVSLRHQGDRLYSFAGTDMRFSATHPFLTHAGASGQSGPATAGVEPTRLMRTMPGLSSRGVAPGVLLPAARAFAGGVQPVQPGALQEHKVARHGMIYDLVTASMRRARATIALGTAHHIRGTSETARFATAPAAAAAIMDIMTAPWLVIAHAMEPVRCSVSGARPRTAKRRLQNVSDGRARRSCGGALLMPEAWSTGAHLAANAHGLAAGLMIRGLPNRRRRQL